MLAGFHMEGMNMVDTTKSGNKESLSDGCDVTLPSKKAKHQIPHTSKKKSPAKSEGSVIAEGKSSCTVNHSKVPSDSNLNDTPKLSPHLQDAENLPATALNNKYPLTYSSWRNMKQRVHNDGAVIEPEFQDFRDFLKFMGPRPEKKFTLDRLNNDDPRYGPDKCFWRDKQAQNNNKSTTIFLTAPDGTKLPLTSWAKITVQKPNTMRKHKTAGCVIHFYSIQLSISTNYCDTSRTGVRINLDHRSVSCQLRLAYRSNNDIYLQHYRTMIRYVRIICRPPTLDEVVNFYNLNI